MYWQGGYERRVRYLNLAVDCWINPTRKLREVERIRPLIPADLQEALSQLERKIRAEEKEKNEN